MYTYKTATPLPAFFSLSLVWKNMVKNGGKWGKVGIILITISTLLYLVFHSILSVLLLLLSFVMIAQGCFSIYMLLFAWNKPREKHEDSLSKYRPPFLSFTAIVPLRDEADVIQDTLQAIAHIKYPEELKEIVVVCHDNDIHTIHEVFAIANKLP